MTTSSHTVRQNRRSHVGMRFYPAWIVVTTLGLSVLGVLLAIQDLAMRVVGDTEIVTTVVTTAVVALAMAVLGTLQSLLLRAHIPHSGWWSPVVAGGAILAIAMWFILLSAFGGHQEFERSLYEATSTITGHKPLPELLFDLGIHVDPPPSVVEEVGRIWRATSIVERAFLGALIGLCIGMGQYLAFWRRAKQAGWWIPISAAAWGMGQAVYETVCFAAYPAVRMQEMAWAKTVVVAESAGGVVLGLISGIALVWLLRNVGNTQLATCGDCMAQHQES